MSMVSTADAYQRRHRWAGLPVAVLYKFGDDQGSYLAAQITYYGFVAAFPLLLLLATILGYALHGNPHLQRQVLDSALAQFPVIGDQVTANIRSFHGSTAGLVIGILGCVYGGLGIVQAVQNTLNKVWGVPRDSRPNPVRARLRSLLLLAFGGASVIVTTVLSALGAAADAYGASLGGSVRALATAAAIALNVTLFTVAFRVLTARRVAVRQIRAGAIAAAVTWQALQLAGTLLLGQKLKGATATYGLFALVLGLLAWIYLGAVTTVICAEFNAVRAGQLWPRSLLAPFTDNADLTPADRRAYTSYAKTERHKSFENIDVSFGERPHPGPGQGNHDPERAGAARRRERRWPSARARSRETCIWEMPSRCPISRLRHVARKSISRISCSRGGSSPQCAATAFMSSMCSSRGSSCAEGPPGCSCPAGRPAARPARTAGRPAPPAGRAAAHRADPQVPGQVGLGRGPAQLLGQLPGRLAGLEHQLLHRAPDVDLPPLVTEVPLELAADARPRVRGQAARRRPDRSCRSPSSGRHTPPASGPPPAQGCAGTAARRTGPGR